MCVCVFVLFFKASKSKDRMPQALEKFFSDVPIVDGSVANNLKCAVVTAVVADLGGSRCRGRRSRGLRRWLVGRCQRGWERRWHARGLRGRARTRSGGRMRAREREGDHGRPDRWTSTKGR